MNGRRFVDRLVRLATGLSVRTKILGMVAAVVCTLGAALGFEARWRLERELASALQAQGAALAREIAARSADLVLTENAFGLHQLVSSVLESNADVRYVFVTDPRGRVLVHSFERGVPAGLLALGGPADRQTVRVLVLATEEGLVTDVAAPIVEGRAGFARVGLTHRRLAAALRRTTWRLTWVTALGLVGGLTVAMLLTHVLVRPIIELRDVTRAVAAGSLSARANRYAADEIGELALAFNNMIEYLAESQTQLLRRMRELETLNAIAAALGAPSALGERLEGALAELLATMRLDAGWILGHTEGSSPRLLAARGVPVSEIPELGDAASGCLCGRAMEEGQPVVGPPEADGGPCWGRRLVAAAGLDSYVCVPLLARERTIGVLTLAGRAGRRFREDELRLLSAVGRQAGLAVEHARLWDELAQQGTRRGQLLAQIIAAQEAERTRVARELHDEAGQLLTSLLIGLRTLEQDPGLSGRAASQVAIMKSVVHRLFDELQQLAVELRPPSLDRLGLLGAIDSYVRDFGERTGLLVDLELSGCPDGGWPEPVEIAVYRIVQEALTNVARHARASRVGVLLERRGEELSVVIEDDGCGFDVDAVLRGQRPGARPPLGLFGIQERVELLHGRFSIESARGRGTTLLVQIPLGANRDQDRAGG
jgi:signal transduction histidine kinase